MNTAYALPPTEWAAHDRQTAQWIDTIPLYDGPWLLSAAEALVQLSALPDNWDGSGSRRIVPAVVTKAIEVIRRLGAAVEPMSHASPVPGGGIQLEWYLRDRYLEIEVLPDGSVEFLTEAGGEKSTEGVLLLTDAGALGMLVRYLSHP